MAVLAQLRGGSAAAGRVLAARTGAGLSRRQIGQTGLAVGFDGGAGAGFSLDPECDEARGRVHRRFGADGIRNGRGPGRSARSGVDLGLGRVALDADGGAAVGQDGCGLGRRDRSGVDLGLDRVALGADGDAAVVRGGRGLGRSARSGVDFGLGRVALGAGARMSLDPECGEALGRVHRGFGADGGATARPGGRHLDQRGLGAGIDGGVGLVGMLSRSWSAVRGADGRVGPRRGV